MEDENQYLTRDFHGKYPPDCCSASGKWKKLLNEAKSMNYLRVFKQGEYLTLRIH